MLNGKANTSSKKDLATLEAMGKIYCKAHHKGEPKDEAGLCQWCRTVVQDTFDRSQNCPNGHQENCQDCDIKCQRGESQANVKKLMAYSAPIMLFRHPLMAATYLRKKLNH